MPYKLKKGSKKRKRSRSSKRDAVPALPLDPMTALALANMRTGGNVFRYNHPGNVEAKYQDWPIGSNNFQTNMASITDANLIYEGPQIPAGNDGVTRIGRQVYVKHLQYRLQCTVKQANQDHIIRLICVLDRQHNAAAAGDGSTKYRSVFNCVVPVIVNGHIAVAAGDLDLSAFRLLDNFVRYKVLLDRIVRAPAVGLASGGQYDFALHTLQGIVPVREKFDYSGNTGLVTEMTTNCIYFFGMIYASHSEAAGSIGGMIRVRFVDA